MQLQGRPGQAGRANTCPAPVREMWARVSHVFGSPGLGLFAWLWTGAPCAQALLRVVMVTSVRCGALSRAAFSFRTMWAYASAHGCGIYS